MLELRPERREVLLPALAAYREDVVARSAEYDPLHFSTTLRVVGEMLDRIGVVDRVSRAGYESWSSGGGLMVWRRDLPDGSYLLVSYEDGELWGDPEAGDWMVGRYNQENGYIQVAGPRLTLAQAITVGGQLPAPVEDEQRDVAVRIGELTLTPVE